MTAPTPKLGDLLERLEAATGPDREIDKAVMLAIGRAREIDPWMFYGPGETVWCFGDYEHESVNPALPYVTASLDAVLALVEEKLPGWTVEIIRLSDGEGFAQVSDDAAFMPVSHEATAPTPALALLKALVCALSSESGASGSDQVEDRTATPGGQTPISQPLKETP